MNRVDPESGAMTDDAILHHFDRLLDHWRARGLDVPGASMEQLLRACLDRLTRDMASAATVRSERTHVIAFAARFQNEADYRFVAALASYAIGLSKPTPLQIDAMK